MSAGATNSEQCAAGDASEAPGYAGTSVRAITVVLLVAIAFLWLAAFWLSLRSSLTFDDSFMFYRYAINMRHGLGMSWNIDGVHTYGETALLWGWVIYALSYLPLSAEHVLRLGSWLCGATAIMAIAWAVAARARSDYMKKVSRVIPLAAFPLMAMPIFMHNAVTGMETMLAVTLAAIFVGLTIGVAQGGTSPLWAGGIGVLLFMTRPEMVLVIVIMPSILLSGMGQEGRRSLRRLAVLLATFLVGMLVEMLCCKLYFKSALPLSFYMKSWHGYEGYTRTWSPIESTLAMVQAWPYVLIIAIWTRRSELRLVVSCLVSMLAAFAYLSTVTQIMGMHSRYYLPYVALVAIPALLVLDSRLIGDYKSFSRLLGEWPSAPHRIALAVLIALAALALFAPARLLHAADRHLEGTLFAYDPVVFQTASGALLPASAGAGLQPIFSVADWIVAPLPRGATIAASEVGYMGFKAPQVNIIDLAGLNDPEIALHGFSVARLLSRKPDIIWMPHPDYTYQRGLMLSSQNLLREYDVYPNAAIFGLAIRKDSIYRSQIESQMQRFWDHFYPGISMDSDLAESSVWSGQKHELVPGVNDLAKPTTGGEDR